MTLCSTKWLLRFKEINSIVVLSVIEYATGS
jgi:hypothetical protein